MIRRRDDAVSPVVGVMLMLVVVIVIAAVVSAFAGGAASGTKKTPQASISAEFSQTDGMKIFHKGGDALNTQDISLVVKPTKSFGNYEHLSWVVNKSVIWTNNKQWVNSSEPYTYKLARTLQPGEMATISAADIKWIQEKNGATGDYTSSSYGFGNSAYSIGNSFVLSINDNSGRSIASTEVIIKP